MSLLGQLGLLKEFRCIQTARRQPIVNSGVSSSTRAFSDACCSRLDQQDVEFLPNLGTFRDISVSSVASWHLTV